jgi:hypothetical protein
MTRWCRSLTNVRPYPAFESISHRLGATPNRRASAQVALPPSAASRAVLTFCGVSLLRPLRVPRAVVPLRHVAVADVVRLCAPFERPERVHVERGTGGSVPAARCRDCLEAGLAGKRLRSRRCGSAT